MSKKTPEQISYNMRKVKSKNSEIECLLRQELWKRNLHYRKNVKNIIGKPDIAFIGKKIAVFVDGEFWHGFDWENKKNEIKTNRDFWIPKIERNMERDREVTRALESDDWIVLRFWGKDIKEDVSGCADIIEKCIREKKI